MTPPGHGDKDSRENSSKYKFRQLEEWKSKRKLAEGERCRAGFRTVEPEVNYICVQWAFRYMSLGLERQ